MPLQLSRQGHVAYVLLETPGKLNAVDVAMWQGLREAFAALATEPDIWCVVVRGAGGNFAAGADIEEFAIVRHDQASGRRYHLEIMAPALAAIRSVPMPTVAAIEGVCVGGGLEIAIACDVRIATEDARLGVPVGRLGFPFALPELVPLLDLVGPGLAAELLLTGRLFDGTEAGAKGLVQRAVPRDHFEALLAETVRGILAGSPAAARQNKAQVRMLLERTPRYSAEELEASFGFLDGADYREGVAAFLAKRPPRFGGDQH
jgi:enoyl-CoA hydratase/carnithine racemase